MQFHAFTFFLLCHVLNQPIFNAIVRIESRLVFKGKLPAHLPGGVRGRLKNQYVSCDTGCAHK